MSQEEAKRPGEDPEAVSLWPNGDFTLDDLTPVDVEKTRGADVGSNLVFPPAEGQMMLRWSDQRSYRKTDRASLTVTYLRTAVLVRRNNETDRFLGFVEIKAKADFAYNMVHVIRELSGNSSANDLISFRPGVQYLRQRISGVFLETQLAENIDGENLDEAHLGRLAGVLSTTVLGRQ